LQPEPSAEDLSEAHSMAAFIEDEILHDADAARADFNQALTKNRSSERARQGIQRLDEADAKRARLEGKS